MKKILMVLTSHRLDCLRLCLKLLEKTHSLQHFDHIVFLLNGVKGRHLNHIHAFMRTHPRLSWDTIAGPRGRCECISSLENQCVERYPGGLYVKIDEDIFVPEGWAPRLFAAYEEHQADENLALIPNNAYGLHTLLTIHYPHLGRGKPNVARRPYRGMGRASVYRSGIDQCKTSGSIGPTERSRLHPLYGPLQYRLHLF